MTTHNAYIENFCDNPKNIKNIPTNWKKFGEVFCKAEQPIFVCSICLKNADAAAYFTSDVSTFWCHIKQQHFSFLDETIETIPPEVDNLDAESVDSEICYGEIKSRENADFSEDKMVRILVSHSAGKRTPSLLPLLYIKYIYICTYICIYIPTYVCMFIILQRARLS